jgi:hypothetical protein
MKALKFKRFKPIPLPPEPDILDWLEYGLQWLVSWFVIEIENHPVVSGMLTGLMLTSPLWFIIFFGQWFLQVTGHWKP